MIKRLGVFFGSIFLALLLLAFFQNSVQAQFMHNWYLDPDGSGATFDREQIYEAWNIEGIAYIDNYGFTDGYNPGSHFSFSEWGFFRSFSHDNETSSSDLWDFVLSGYELTAIFTANGTGVLGGNISFTSGSLEIYIDESSNYSSNTSASDPGIYYGANDGTKIASFELIYGYGKINETGLPNGDISIAFQATYIEPGYFFDPTGRDLSTYPLIWVLGYSTTNASPQNPDRNFVSEIFNWTGHTPQNNNPEELVIRSGGQWRMQVVPEPATIMLLGAGLLGVAVYVRKRVK